MSELLLELFSEEIPARMQARAARDLEKLVQKELFDAGFRPEGAKAFATPRRLTLVVSGLTGTSPDIEEEKKGPRVGAPDQAVAGFLKSAGLASLDQCETRSDKKGDYYVAVISQKGRPTADIIASFMPELIRKFPWPKSQRWGAGSLKWVRPLKRILCVYDTQIVRFEIEGIISGDITEGHRFMAPGEIQTRNFEDYQAKLRRAKVILDPVERQERILEEAKALCAVQGLELIEDEGLLMENAGLAEWPSPRIGSFDEKFLEVPAEALIASMKGHQKYFSVHDPKTGKLANKFICVANVEPEDGGKAMMTGYERVLTARLSDAFFMYRQDLKIALSEQAKKLDKIVFFEGLGTLGDKVQRVTKLAREIAPQVGADPDLAEQAAKLAKADLVTGMVAEFPKLQGVMGRYYALQQGASKDEGRATYKKDDIKQIADAIRDHYKPAGENDAVPTAPVSVALALAEKIDTLTGFWAINKKPTGSKDPFALRRAALGVIQIVLENNLRLPLNSLNVTPDLLGFFHDRLSVYLKDKNHQYDHINAVLLRPDGSREDDLVLIVKKLEALEAFLKTQDGTNLSAAYKRATNILKAEQKKTGPIKDSDVRAKLLTAKEEIALHAALEKVSTAVQKDCAEENFAAAMAQLSSLRGPLDAFFEAVKVNDEDAGIRVNRLALLTGIKQICDGVADLGEVES